MEMIYYYLHRKNDNNQSQALDNNIITYIGIDLFIMTKIVAI